MQTRKITVLPYDEAWESAFSDIKSELERALGGLIVGIEHVGSTSVEGLSAKPCIDIDVIIKDYSVFDDVVKALANIGYTHEGDLGIKDREAFKYSNKEHLMQHHLYVCPQYSEELHRHITFRNFLCENPADSERLAAEESIINRIFDEYDKLGMEIGVLWVDEKIVAFAVGERIGETLYVHFEKALRSYDGSFEAINCLFVREFKGDAKFVDREEDMNDLGLRQANMAYNPVYLVDKYVAILN